MKRLLFVIFIKLSNLVFGLLSENEIRYMKAGFDHSNNASRLIVNACRGYTMKVIKFFLLSCAVYSLAYSDYYNLSIVALHNESDAPVSVGRLEIRPESNSKAISLPIPFVSFYDNHDAFIQNSPYFPREALIIKMGRKRWGIWEEERGIVCAVHPDDYALYEHHVPSKLLRRVFNKQKPHASSKNHKVLFLLKILKDVDKTKPLALSIVDEE